MLGINKYSDQKVVSEVRNGNEEFLDYLYIKHRVMIKNFILKNNGSEDDVSEIVHEVVIITWQNIAKPTFLLHSKLSTYVMGIVKNLWYKELKKRSKFTVVDETYDQPTSDEEKTSFDKQIIIDMVNELDDTCRKLLSLFYFDGFSQDKIADQMGFANASTVKAKKYQCFKKLQKRVTDQFQKSDFL